MTHASASAWYADFFTELPNAWWRAVMPPQATAADVDFVVAAVGLSPGARILDVPCGSGRHALELARRGQRVTGLDVSAEAVAHARAAAATEGLDIDLHVGDMRRLPTGLRVDAALCLGNSFGYLDHAGNERFLAGLAELVTPGGALVVDYAAVAESVLTRTADTAPMWAAGIRADAIDDYDPVRGHMRTAFTFRRGTQEHRGTAVQHVYTAAEVIRMVRAAGFDDVAPYGDVDGTPFQVGSQRLLLVARRPARTSADVPRRSSPADVENAVAAPTQCERADRGAGTEE
jgi:SAM-dependent methyltransferase